MNPRYNYKSNAAKAVMWNQSDRNGLQRPKCIKCGTQMHLFGLIPRPSRVQTGIQGNREHRCWKIFFGRTLLNVPMSLRVLTGEPEADPLPTFLFRCGTTHSEVAHEQFLLPA